jgi:hypothetical protein
MPADRPHDVSGLTAAELDRARRDLKVSLVLARPGSAVCAPIAAQLSAIDTELARRSADRALALCSCGFATNDPNWMDGHLFTHPGHHVRPQPPQLPVAEHDG